MFFAILFIAIGLALLLNTLGLLNGTFWGLFWAIFFLAIGLKMIMRKDNCPMCGWGAWKGKMHEKMHGGHAGSCCGHNHEHEHHEAEDEEGKN